MRSRLVLAFSLHAKRLYIYNHAVVRMLVGGAMILTADEHSNGFYYSYLEKMNNTINIDFILFDHF